MPIVRANDGLALSSRNQYLTDAERAIAPTLNQELNRLADNIRSLQQSDALYFERITNVDPTNQRAT